MRSHLVSFFLLGAVGALLTSCGSAPPNPTAPREVTIQVNASQGTEFDVIELRTASAIHRPCPLQGAHFVAPYRFILENAPPPIQATFQPADPNAPIDDAQLLLGGDLVPILVDHPDENTPIFTGLEAQPLDPDVPACGSKSFSGAHDVRFDISGTTGVQFSATIGDQSSSHIVGSANQIPATFYMEDAFERVTGVFTKFGSNGTLTAQLIVDGNVVSSAGSPDGVQSDIVVKYEF